MNRLKFILVPILLVTLSIWLSVFQTTNTLKIIACDVGQGDALLTTYGKTQILIDGGLANGKVVECLGSHMPFLDRTIEVVILTHPQLDHYGGLIEVVQRYNVTLFLANRLDSDALAYQELKDQLSNRNIRIIHPDPNQDIRLGELYLDILWPDISALSEKADPNDFSIVTLLSFRDFDALFTGDIGPKISDSVAEILISKNIIGTEYIKVPHHGSKNGMTQKLLDIVGPEVAAISVGTNNRYGHPSMEILEMLTNSNVKILRTDLEGDVVVESNGMTFW